MLKRSTIFAIGLSSLLSLANTAAADQERGNRHDFGNHAQSTKPYLKTHHRQDYRGYNHRPQRKQYRPAYRNNHKHWKNHRPGNHRHYHYYRPVHDHDFVYGLVFGGALGYIIGNDY